MNPWSRLRGRLINAWHRRARHVALVQGSARALTGRPLEAPQADSMARRIAEDPAAMQTVIAEILQTSNAQHHAASSLILDGPAAAMRTCFISMGTHCFTASLLQRWGLRAWSGPCDWLFTSPTMLAHMLDDDFATLLDRTQYRPVPPERRVAGPDVNRVDHAFYRDRHGVAFVFNHHDVHLDDGYAYLVRCVERLRAQLRADTHKTFLLFRRAESTRVEEMVALQRALAARTRNFRLCAFAVVSGPTGSLPQAEVLRADETLSLWRYRPCSNWNNLAFDSPLDELAVLRLASHVA